jgi:hypothetical protein
MLLIPLADPPCGQSGKGSFLARNSFIILTGVVMPRFPRCLNIRLFSTARQG